MLLFEKKIRKTTLIFGIFLLIILFYSFDYSFGWGMKKMYPDIYIFSISKGNSGPPMIIWNENGLVENIQAILLLITVFILIRIVKEKKHINKITTIFVFINIFFISFIFFEEISWGQHFLKFETPSIFIEKNSFLYNKQQELNLHNMSSLFNEIPRNLVLIWCSLSIPILRLFKLEKFGYLKTIIEPNKNLIYLSLFILIISFQEALIDKLELFDGSKLYIMNDGIFERFNNKQLILNIISFKFIRFSELQELLFFYYFLCHSLFLKKLLFCELKKC